jgi:hypothetical protein
MCLVLLVVGLEGMTRIINLIDIPLFFQRIKSDTVGVKAVVVKVAHPPALVKETTTDPLLQLPSSSPDFDLSLLPTNPPMLSLFEWLIWYKLIIGELLKLIYLG